MIKSFILNKSLLFGVSFILTLFLSSLFYYLKYDDYIPQPGIEIRYTDEGQLLRSPYTPIVHPPFGTDPKGRDLFFIILVGAKYTIGAAFLITFCRILIGLILGTALSLYAPKFLKVVSNTSNSLSFFPFSILCFFLLNWVLVHDFLYDGIFTFSLIERVLIMILVLTIFAVPTLTVLFASEINKILSYDFIESSRILGGSKLHVLKNHIKPYLLPQVFIIYFREFTQVMLLLAHLGIIGIFLGGGTPETDLFFKTKIISASNEWSGLIGTWWSFIWTTYPWIAFIPVLFFTITILAGKLIVLGLTEVNNKQY
jgi:peptide/nickel transport system permease protein